VDGNALTADFILGMDWNGLPASVRRRAKICLMDALGATLAGALAPISRIAAAYAADAWRGNEATVLSYEPGTGLQTGRASAAGAAFANACAGNALDIDDDAIFTRGHPGAQLIPAVLAVAEEVGASGRSLLEGLVVGYEVAIRAGRCWHAHHSIYRADGSWGSVACAAAAARLLGLSSPQIQHALGIAEYHAPNAPMMRDIASPAMTKHAIGWGAMTGVTSAELALRGYTGIPSILGFAPYRDWVADLGETYWMADWVFYKEWCSCAWGHPACVAAQQMVRAHRLDVKEISRIRVHAFDEAARLYQGYPTTTEEAQFSLKWPLACLLLDGEIGPNQILEHRLEDPLVRALVDRIEIVLDPQIDALYKAAQEMDLRMHGRVEIIAADGRTFDSGIVERAADRFDETALVHKFRWLVGHVLPPHRVDALVAMLREFENVNDVRELTALLDENHRN
jgi:2-methylcitrate dehydratase PrpD